MRFVYDELKATRLRQERADLAVVPAGHNRVALGLKGNAVAPGRGKETKYDRKARVYRWYTTVEYVSWPSQRCGPQEQTGGGGQHALLVGDLHAQQLGECA